MYEAPERLGTGSPNRLRALADVTGLVTDGAFFPDGRHLVLRTYTKALVYSFPDLSLLGEIDLPGQRQGEGIAVLDDEVALPELRRRQRTPAAGRRARRDPDAMGATDEPEPSASASEPGPAGDPSRGPRARRRRRAPTFRSRRRGRRPGPT